MAGITDFLGGGLGLIGNLFNVNQQRHASDFARSEGDPYRSQLRAMTADPSLYYQGPEGQSLAKMLDQRYSAQFGNPAGSGTAQALAADALTRGFSAKQALLGKLGGLEDINSQMGPARTAQSNANLGVFGSLMDLLAMFGGGGKGGGNPFEGSGLDPSGAYLP